MNEEHSTGPEVEAPAGDSGAAASSSLAPQEQRTMGMLCHLCALAGFVIPFGNILGPLIVWLIKKDEMPFVDDQGKEAVNFQITMLIAMIVLAVVSFCILGLAALVPWVMSLVFAIIAALKANEGQYYRYPLSIRMIK